MAKSQSKPKYRSADRQAFVVALLATVLASLFVSLTLRDSEPLTGFDRSQLKPLKIGRSDIRVRLKTWGKGPWQLTSPSGWEIQQQNAPHSPIPFGARIDVMMREGKVWINNQDVGSDIQLRTRSAENFRSKRGEYRGDLRFAAKHSSNPILAIDLESYVAQVLAKEMPLSFGEEALKAQAIAIRTYALYNAQQRAHRAWDLSDTESSQVFGAVDVTPKRARVMAQKVSGVVLTHDGALFESFFSSTCGGRTRAVQRAFDSPPMECLKSVDCGHCSWSGTYRWRHVVALQTVLGKLGIRGSVQKVHVEAGDESGYGANLVIFASTGIQRIPGQKLKRLLGPHKIKSSHLSGAAINNGKLTIRGRGFGHGVGLCQNGAQGMAKQGYRAQRILQHYYPGAQCMNVNKND